MRDTSLEAWHFINESGWLGTARRQAYQLLYQHGPMAQFEVERFEPGKYYGGTLSKRFHELESMGMAMEEQA